MGLEKNVASGNRISGYVHKAELVWWGALIFLYSQLLPHNISNTPCSHFVPKLKTTCSAGERRDETIALFVFSVLGNTGRANCEGKKEETNTYLPKRGLSFWPVGWAKLITSFSEESWLQWKLQCWCQEIQSFPILNDQRRLFSHWRLLASSSKATQDLKVQGDFLKWQDNINLCLKGNRNESTSSAIGKSFIVSYWIQTNRIKFLFFSLLRAVHLVDKGR